jgi:integrating conjugative element protein (TIGR03755 family)
MKLFLTLILIGIITNAYAINIVPSDSNYYYRLGGGSDISMPPVTDQKDITLGGDMNVNLGYTCDGFNPAISIANTINNIKSSVEGLSQDVINSATAAVGSMPMYILQKASPEIYNLVQNTMSNAADTFHLSMKSCQDSLDEIKEGKSPYQDWFSISDSQGWLNYAKQAQQGQDVDVNNAKQQITKDPEQYGVPWVHHGQNSGGSIGNQASIEVIKDVVIAGYNAMVDKNLALDTNVSAPTGSELGRFWPTSKDAGDWARLVLGDITISSQKGHDETHAGIGLVTILRKCPDVQSVNNDLTCAKNIQKTLIGFVQNVPYPDAAKLAQISSSQMMITPDVIASIRNRTTEEQAVAISKISEDVAIQNLSDEALLLRRVLIAGSQTKPVQNVKPALVTIERTINQLDKDLKDLKFEHDIKAEFSSNTLQTILANGNADKLQASQQHDQTQEPNMQNGAVYK